MFRPRCRVPEPGFVEEVLCNIGRVPLMSGDMPSGVLQIPLSSAMGGSNARETVSDKCRTLLGAEDASNRQVKKNNGTNRKLAPREVRETILPGKPPVVPPEDISCDSGRKETGGAVVPVFSVTGLCKAADFRLDQSVLDFGPIAKGSQLFRRLGLSNCGDLPAK
ncbi:unnamed protein product [Protopolystoma xenopodis]|uniref:Uncharacterized protein n=1 Tax=Protopolystoma xenopodis TaxID=117903 RepID=A0A3S5AEB1_9PLAT|nr:unnamed protein product [Protopolystoma xenopodis]